MFGIFGWACAGHARNCCVDHEYSTNYPFLYLAQGIISFPFPQMSGIKYFFKDLRLQLTNSSWNPADGSRVTLVSAFGFIFSKTTCDLAPNDSFFNSKHDADFLRDLVLIDLLFFSNTRRIQMLQGHHLGHQVLAKNNDYSKVSAMHQFYAESLRTPPLHKLTARMCNMRRVEDKNSYKVFISGNGVDEAKDTEVAVRRCRASFHTPLRTPTS